MLLRYGGLLVTLLTILGVGVVLLPYFWMVSSSLKTGAEVFELPIRWIPQVLQWANYPNALSRGSFGIYFFNSAFVARLSWWGSFSSAAWRAMAWPNSDSPTACSASP